jgi:glycosyltransferase involved in cell wall biosynthesis
MTPPSQGGLLLYEPRTEGHHLNWLQMIVEDLRWADLPVKLAVDLRPESEPRVRAQLGGLVPPSAWFNAYEPRTSKTQALARCLARSGAAQVFLCAFDEIASALCRRAAWGFLPPAALRGRMGGIYHRPRFLAAPRWSPNRWLKRAGFTRLIRHGWLRPLLFLDEYIAAELQRAWPQGEFSFLPGPCPPPYEGDRTAARRQLGVPDMACIFLFYGGGYRRKGLHLAVRALLELPAASAAFLLCVGEQDPSADTARGLAELASHNRARVLKRDHIPLAEERAAFVACDVVLLPYLRHFGTSDVLLRAMAAAKPVIVSEEQLLGRLTREYGLGLLFPSGNVRALRECLRQAAAFSTSQTAAFAAAARRAAQRYSRQSFRQALLASLRAPPPLH